MTKKLLRSCWGKFVEKKNEAAEMDKATKNGITYA